MQFASLRQLTLLSFILALVPLAILLVHSQSVLTDLSKIASTEAEYAIDLTKDMSDAERMAANIERHLRQFNVVQNNELKTLLSTYYERIGFLLEGLCRELDEQQVCINVDTRLAWFEANQVVVDELLLDAQLADFNQSLSELFIAVDSHLARRIQEHKIFVIDVQQVQTWLTIILVGLSLPIIWLATRMILTPVEKIERIIGTLASQSGELPPVTERGPRELVDVERKLHNLSDRLSQLESLRQALLRHASHELKTPLASIKEGCSLLSDEIVGELSGGQAEVVTLLNSSADRLSTLIEQLLDYNMLLQQAKPEYQVVKCDALFDQFIEENSLAIKQHRTEVRLDIEPDVVTVDANLFRRILDNLLSNALAHGARGRPVTISLRQKESEVELDVANVGRPIEPEMRKAVFDPFKRGDNQRNDRVTGSGLGLSIVADCARMMHGHVKIIDVEYADVCVRVTLPLHGESG